MLSPRQLMIPLLTGLTLCAPARADVVVVVSARSAVSALSLIQTAEIFQGKSASFPNGDAATPIDQTEESSVRSAFYLKTVGKTPVQMSAYWSKMIFTGQGRPPQEIGDSEAIKKFVAANPHAIGYIDRSALDASVKPVLSLR